MSTSMKSTMMRRRRGGQGYGGGGRRGKRMNWAAMKRQRNEEKIERRMTKLRAVGGGIQEEERGGAGRGKEEERPRMMTRMPLRLVCPVTMQELEEDEEEGGFVSTSGDVYMPTDGIFLDLTLEARLANSSARRSRRGATVSYEEKQRGVGVEVFQQVRICVCEL